MTDLGATKSHTLILDYKIHFPLHRTMKLEDHAPSFQPPGSLKNLACSQIKFLYLHKTSLDMILEQY